MFSSFLSLIDLFWGQFGRNQVFFDGIGAAVTPCPGNNANGLGAVDPVFAGQDKAIGAGFIPNVTEFSNIKIRVMHFLP